MIERLIRASFAKPALALILAVAGTVLGAGLGMLFAPKAGSELRNQISEQAGNLAGMEAIQNRLSDLKLNADTRAGDLEGADYAAAVVGLKQQESTFEATLAKLDQVLPPQLRRSMMRFLPLIKERFVADENDKDHFFFACRLVFRVEINRRPGADLTEA